MTNIRPDTYYSQRVNQIQNLLKRSKKRLRYLALFRLLVFLLVFPSFFILTPKILSAGLVLTIMLIAAFLILIKAYLRQESLHKHLQALLEINQKELEAFKYNFSAFAPGMEYIDTEHAFSYDMDIFGDGSVFQFINRTVTSRGTRLLAKWLSCETLDKVKITDRQEAVKELKHIQDITQDFRAAGGINSDTEQDLEIVEDWISQPTYYLHRKIYLVLAWLLPTLTVSSLILLFFIPGFNVLAPLLYILQLLIVGRRFKHTSAQHMALSKRLQTLSKFQALAEIIERGKYKSSILEKIQKTLNEGEFSAAHSLKSLTKIVSAFDSRLNFVAAIFLEGLLLWDIQCMIRLERWKVQKGSKLGEWVEALSRYDTLVSLGTLAFNNPEFTFPKVDDKTILRAKDLGHILIPAAERVCNDFEIKSHGDFILITGANMAGKSTFLRTVASNMILAMTGAPVCASEFSFQPSSIFSSMRTSDSLNKHESYFYAELKRLKDLLDRLRAGESLFIILDEILKGTNSTDKQKGSRAALEQIIELGGTGIIATHDLELASIEKQFPEKVSNMCFEIEIDQAKISFDYKLQPGITTKMNALLLMEQMGIIRA